MIHDEMHDGKSSLPHKPGIKTQVAVYVMAFLMIMQIVILDIVNNHGIRIASAFMTRYINAFRRFSLCK
jgi:hypothetical protein